MLKLFNKEKKKSTKIENVLSLDEFFKREEYEINEEFWKMNATQLEETCKRQEKYIKNLKKQYQMHLEYLEQLLLKHEDEKKKLRTEIEELQIKCNINFEQKQQIEEQYKQLYDQKQQSPSQQPQNNEIQINKENSSDLLGLNEPQEEELERLRIQCSKVCEEMRRLQEDNDDITIALETEKNHKNQIIQQYEQELKQQKEQIQQNQQIYNEEQDKLNQKIQKQYEQIQYLQQYEIEQNELKTKQEELESKLLQEKNKCESKSKDCQRYEEQINELKQQYEQNIQQTQVYQSKNLLLESKRQNAKQTINELKNQINNLQQNIELIQFQQKNEIQTITLQSNEYKIKNDLYENLKSQYDQIQNQLMDKNLKIQSLFHQISDMEIQIDNLRKNIEKQEQQFKQKDIEKDNIIQHLTIKRENAKVEIEQLNDKICSCMKVIDSIKTKAAKNNDIQQIIKHNSDILSKSEIVIKSHRRIQLFPTLYKCLQDLRKLEDKCYKLYIQCMVTDFKTKEESIQIERMLNDIGRRSQDIIDLLDEMGLK